MKIKCNKCGYGYEEIEDTVIYFKVNVGVEEFHLCPSCAKKLVEWILCFENNELKGKNN